MSKTASIRSERIELRTKPEAKRVLASAAELRHTTISAYLLESGFERAQKDLNQVETLSLTSSDRDQFFSILSTPPEPNTALRGLF